MSNPDDFKSLPVEQMERIAELEAVIRTARTLIDHVIHGENDLASLADVHEILTEGTKT